MVGVHSPMKCMILFIYVTFLHTIIQGDEISRKMRRIRVLATICHDQCGNISQIDAGHTACADAVMTFSHLSPNEQVECLLPRDPQCRMMRCSAICDPTLEEIQAAGKDGLIAQPTVKTLMAMAIPMIRNLEKKQQKQRYQRRQQQQQQQQQLQNDYTIERVQQILQHEQQEEQSLRDGVRLRKRERASTRQENLRQERQDRLELLQKNRHEHRQRRHREVSLNILEKRRRTGP